MILTEKDKNKDITVLVVFENKERHGLVVGTSNHLVCVLLNTGEYIDVPENKVKRL